MTTLVPRLLSAQIQTGTSASQPLNISLSAKVNNIPRDSRLEISPRLPQQGLIYEYDVNVNIITGTTTILTEQLQASVNIPRTADRFIQTSPHQYKIRFYSATNSIELIAHEPADTPVVATKPKDKIR